MPTDNQQHRFLKKLRVYRSKYIKNKYAELDESATRLMINYLLTELLGYVELEEIRTEQMINNTYADYIIQVDRKKRFIVEVKAIQIDLSEKHLRQAVNYAANEGVDWVLLTNGREIDLYRVIFKKPITQKKLFAVDLRDASKVKEAAESLILLSRKHLLNGELEDFWKRFQALEPNNLCRYFYSKDIMRFLRRVLKRDAGLSFSEEDIFDSVHEIIINKIDSQKPKSPIVLTNKRREPPREKPQQVMVRQEDHKPEPNQIN